MLYDFIFFKSFISILKNIKRDILLTIYKNNNNFIIILVF